jgi:YesN/AraC family two-component response regulator
MNKNKIKLLKQYTVLLVDDDNGILEELGELLNSFFKIVYVCNNGLDAYDLYLKHSPDLIISDIQMPKQNGIDFIKNIRNIDNKINLCLLSSYTNLDYLLDASELNLLKYLVKPITNIKLFDLFQKFLDKKNLSNAVVLGEDYILHKDLSYIKIKNKICKLTNKELQFITLLLNKQSIVTYSEIENILNSVNYGSEHNIRQFIKKTRSKLPKNYISNIQQCGYVISTKYLEANT